MIRKFKRFLRQLWGSQEAVSITIYGAEDAHRYRMQAYWRKVDRIRKAKAIIKRITGKDI